MAFVLCSLACVASRRRTSKGLPFWNMYVIVILYVLLGLEMYMIVICPLVCLG